jgi:hypothetical protein
MAYKPGKGQTLAEFALVAPILILLFFGMFYAAFYAFRAAAADWAVFITGVASGAYEHPATSQAHASILWPELRNRVEITRQNPRTVRSRIAVETQRSWIFGLQLREAQRGTALFRLWRFYPGPPPPGGSE